MHPSQAGTLYAIALSIFTYGFLAFTMAGAFDRVTLAYDQDFYSKATAWSVRAINGGEVTGLWGGECACRVWTG